MNILIENTVPFNNGDAALIFSLGEAIAKKNNNVTYSTTSLENAKKLYPEKNWIESPLKYRVFRMPILGKLLLLLYISLNRSKYNDFDAMISAPGGYVNSYYSITVTRIYLMTCYKKILKKPIYLYSQSIGPLSNKDEKQLVPLFSQFDLLYARDILSYDRLVEMGFERNTVLTKDGAFLLESISSLNKLNKVAISVRTWKFDGRSKEVYEKMIVAITSFFLKKGYQVVFLSTCQGLTEYIDDSAYAKEIVESFLQDNNKNVKVDTNYYSLKELRVKLSEFDYVIGTRLHMCILSWLSNTPAFNISYEEKGKESYKYLGLSKFSIDYNYEGDIEEKLNDFVNSNFSAAKKLINDIHEEANNFLSNMIEDIRGKK